MQRLEVLRYCATDHKENDSQDVDEIDVADNAEKGPLPKKKIRIKENLAEKTG